MYGGEGDGGRMPCDAAREQLLVADVDELGGTGDSQLARHVRRCERCRAAADRIFADQEALDRALTDLARERSSILAARPVERPVAAAEGRRRAWRRTLPLAAAAVVAALLLLPPALRREGPARLGDTPGEVAVVSADPSGAEAELSLQVEAPPGGRMAVFETRDPSITVVWFY